MEPALGEQLISVVVIARNEEQTIEGCLAAARSGIESVGGGEILLVDSASTDRTAAKALGVGCRVVTVRKASRICPSAGRRIGASMTRSCYVLFLDGDCELEPGFLPAALDAMKKDSTLGVVAGRRRDLYRTKTGILLAEDDYYLHHENRSPLPVYGGCALYRRRALEAAGSFDPFLRSKEEEELAYRIQGAGFRIDALPIPMVRHTTVPRESVGRIARSLNHGFFIGRGQAARLFLVRGRWEAAFRGLQRVLLVWTHLILGVLCLWGWAIGARWPAAAWMAVTVVAYVAFIVRGRGIRRATYYVAEWLIQCGCLLIGMLMPLRRAESFQWEGEEQIPGEAWLRPLPRVLLVGPRPDPPFLGGVEKGVDLLLRSDLARRTSMRSFNNYRSRDPKRRVPERIQYMVRKILALRRELMSHPVDLVHVKTSSGINFHQNALYALVARLSGFPVVLQIHCGKFAAFYEKSPAPLRFWIRKTLTRATLVAALSRAWADRILSIAPKARVRVVPNGLEDSELTLLRSGGEIRRAQALFVGTGQEEIDREKGLEHLLGVLPEVARGHPECRWVLAGLADPEGVHARLAAAGTGADGGENPVRCLGMVDGEGRAALLRESSILILPSHFENMPNLLLEAMAAGLGVVATDVGAVPEMLGDGEGGLLVSPRDRAALLLALDRLLSSPSLVRNQGKRNRETVARAYTMDVVQKRLEEIYREASGWPAAVSDEDSAADTGSPGERARRTLPFSGRSVVDP